MKILPFVFAVWLISGHDSAVTPKCGSQSKNNIGSITTNVSATANVDCVWTFMLNKTESKLKYFFFYVNDINLDDGDSFSIVENNETNILFEGNNANFAYISADLNPTLTLNCSSKAMTRQLHINYNIMDCIVSNEKESGLIVEPEAGEGVSKLNCSYTLKSSPKSNKVQYVSFTDFNLGSSSSVIILNGDKRSKNQIATYSGKGKVSDVMSSGSDMTLRFTLDYSVSHKPSFHAHYTAVDDCSKMISGSEVYVKSPNFPHPYPPTEMDCRYIIKMNPNEKMFFAFDHFEISQSAAVEIRNGLRSDSELLATFTNETYSPTRHIGTTANYAWMRFTTNAEPSSRGFIADIKSDLIGGYYKDQGSITLKAADASPGVVYQFLLAVEPNKQVTLDFKPDIELSPSAHLWIYNGYDETTSDLLDILGSDRQIYQVVSNTNKMMVLAKDFTFANNFIAKFNGMPYGYHNVSSGDAGAKIVDSVFLGNLSWAIRPLMFKNQNRSISLTVKDVLLMGNDKIEIYPLDMRTSPLVTYNAQNMKAGTIYVPLSSGIFIQIHRSYKYTQKQTVFSASYEIVPECKSSYDLSKMKSVTVTSLNYPSEYPLEASCSWSFKMPASKMAFVPFKQLNILPQHSVRFIDPKNQVFKSFTGNNLPDDVIISGLESFRIEFTPSIIGKSASSAPGFQMDVKAMDCGGIVNGPNGDLKTPKFPDKVTSPLLCVWKVNVPWNGASTGSHQFISFTTSITPNTTNLLNFEIYEGGSIQSPVVANVTAEKGGQSKLNVITVLYDKLDATILPGLSLNYHASSCNADNQCGDGSCIHDNWRCNGNVECNDGADELNCTNKITEKVKHGVASYVVVICVLLFFIFGLLLGVFVPKLYQRYQANRAYSSFSNLPVVTD